MKAPPGMRFLSYVRETEGCHLWMGGRLRKGYGSFDGGAAHRFAWELVNGPVPSGLHVLHRCDTPACVRVDHLWLGTSAENTADRVAKGRSARGETHGRSRLSLAQVQEILASKSGPTEIARQFGITAAHVMDIRAGRRWAHVSAEVAQ